MKTKKTITIAEIDRQIHEEIARLKKIDQIKSRLKVVTEELKRLDENGIDEVEVGGTKSGEQWYQKGTPVAKFEKKGSHMLETDPAGDEDGLSDEMPSLDMGGDDLGGEEGVDLGGEAEGEIALDTFEEKLAAIGRELDMKLSGEAAEEPEMDATVVDDTAVDDAGDDADADAEIDLDADVEEEKPEEDEIEIDEAAIEVKKGENPFAKKDEKEEECMEEEKTPMNESADRLGRKKNPLLEAELKRAQRLAGLED
mgnify:CR=1 FL=1